jgi:hypothetical protein
MSNDMITAQDPRSQYPGRSRGDFRVGNSCIRKR